MDPVVPHHHDHKRSIDVSTLCHDSTGSFIRATVRGRRDSTNWLWKRRVLTISECCISCFGGHGIGDNTISCKNWCKIRSIACFAKILSSVTTCFLSIFSCGWYACKEYETYQLDKREMQILPE